jgi:hypothetical protein
MVQVLNKHTKRLFYGGTENGSCRGIYRWMWPFYLIIGHNKMGSLNFKNYVHG